MTKAPEQDVKEKDIIQISTIRIITSSKLRISNETLSKRKTGKILFYHGLISFTKYYLMIT